MSTETLIARHAILNALATHSRGVDRADVNLLAAAYHDGATVDYGFFSGAASRLASILAAAQKQALPTLHRTANTEIRIGGDHAVSESYVIAYSEEPEIQRMVFGRYLDRHECRDGVWKLTHRTYVLDSNTNRPNTALRADPPVSNDNFVPEGGKGATDPGRALIAHHQAASRSLQKAEPMTTESAALDAALSRDAIRKLNTRYCRGVDRGDADLLASIFWDDADVISGIVNGSGPDFAREIVAFVTSNLDSCFHSVANEWIEVSGDHGVGEHYIIAQMRAEGADTLTGGRYVDSYERRGGEWRIKSRTFVADWTSTHPTTFESGGFYEALTTRGCFGRTDPVYALWESL
ncbi:MAG: nuclear transport factor 2 family protein [Novosphingobium sp.]